MDGFPDTVTLSRLQFALTIMFHILWPVATIGLSLFLVFLEVRWIRTGNEEYYRHARFWSRLFFLNVAIGVATGIPMEFQFGTNWSEFARAGGDFFGHMLGYEAAMAFMLEASFIGIMIFGWKRVSPAIHLFATSMVALGASLSAFWIMVANSWMQTPRGGFFDNGKFVVTSHLEAIFNPDMVWSVSAHVGCGPRDFPFCRGRAERMVSLQQQAYRLFPRFLQVGRCCRDPDHPSADLARRRFRPGGIPVRSDQTRRHGSPLAHQPSGAGSPLQHPRLARSGKPG